MHGPSGRVLIVLIVAVLVSGATTGAATDEVRRSIDRVTAILADPALQGPARTTERRAALRRVLDGAIDFPEAARRALGTHWSARSQEERAEFLPLFEDLVAYSYIVRMELYAGQKVVFAGESVEDDRATVRTRIEATRGEIPIDYRVHRRDGRWLVYDVSVEGVSLVANYRAQFNTIIRTTSYRELVARMKARVSELRAAPPGAR